MVYAAFHTKFRIHLDFDLSFGSGIDLGGSGCHNRMEDTCSHESGSGGISERLKSKMVYGLKFMV